jgi:hypothetical protein
VLCRIKKGIYIFDTPSSPPSDFGLFLNSILISAWSIGRATSTAHCLRRWYQSNFISRNSSLRPPPFSPTVNNYPHSLLPRPLSPIPHLPVSSSRPPPHYFTIQYYKYYPPQPITSRNRENINCRILCDS